MRRASAILSHIDLTKLSRAPLDWLVQADKQITVALAYYLASIDLVRVGQDVVLGVTGYFYDVTDLNLRHLQPPLSVTRSHRHTTPAAQSRLALPGSELALKLCLISRSGVKGVALEGGISHRSPINSTFNLKMSGAGISGGQRTAAPTRLLPLRPFSLQVILLTPRGP